MTELLDNRILQKQIFDSNTILDTVLSSSTEISKAALRLLIKLLKISQTNVYIPGKTRIDKRSCMQIMIHGLIPVLIHISMNSKDRECIEIINEYINKFCDLKELEWNMEILNNITMSPLDKLSLPEITITNTIEKNNEITPKQNTELTVPIFFTSQGFGQRRKEEFSPIKVDLSRQLNINPRKEYILSEYKFII